MDAEPEDPDSDSIPMYVCFYRIHANLIREGEGLRRQNGDAEPEDPCRDCSGLPDGCSHPMVPKFGIRNYAAVDRFPNGRPDVDYDD